MSKAPVIAIDGPAGAGKSTVAKAVADQLNLRYLDTGAMYRALALKATRLGLDPHSEASAAKVLSGTSVDFSPANSQAILLDGEDVGDLIRTPEIGEAASTLSAYPEVRRWLVARQKTIIEEGGVILEGRDATTVIAPDADLKIFLTASLEERARRRLLEFQAKGLSDDYTEVRSQIENRDHRDITRTESPLKVATEAVVVESANRSPKSVCDEIVRLLRERQNNP